MNHSRNTHPGWHLRLLVNFLTLALALACGNLAAQTWPAKPIRLVVTYPPGGTVDAVARLIGPRLALRLGQPVVIDNRGGAGGLIGGDLVAKSPADGYTVMFDASSHAQNPALRGKMPFDTLRDLAPVTLLLRVPTVLVVHPGYTAQTLGELIAQAKVQPGAVNYASSGIGSAQHLAGALLDAMAQTRMTHVAYKGGGPAMADVMAGQVPVFFASLGSSLTHIKAGKLRALAMVGKTRATMLPEVPTFAEAGLPGYEIYEWNGVFVPTGTPRAVIERLTSEITAVLKEPEIRDRLEAIGADIIGSSPAELDAFRRAEISKWSQLARDKGIVLE